MHQSTTLFVGPSDISVGRLLERRDCAVFFCVRGSRGASRLGALGPLPLGRRKTLNPDCLSGPDAPAAVPWGAAAGFPDGPAAMGR